MLGQAATTEGTPGRLGSDGAQADVRHDILVGDCADLADTINRDLVAVYVALNHGPRDPRELPRIVLRPPDPEDVDSLSRSLRALVPLGLRVEAAAVRKRLRLPDPPEGAEVLEAPPARQSAGSGALALAARGTEGRAASLLEELEESALGGWQRVMDPLLAPLRELVERSSTPEEFEAGLAAALAGMDDGPLRAALAAAAFAARGLGDGRDAA